MPVSKDIFSWPAISVSRSQISDLNRSGGSFLAYFIGASAALIQAGHFEQHDSAGVALNLVSDPVASILQVMPRR